VLLIYWIGAQQVIGRAHGTPSQIGVGPQTNLSGLPSVEIVIPDPPRDQPSQFVVACIPLKSRAALPEEPNPTLCTQAGSVDGASAFGDSQNSLLVHILASAPKSS